jgi:hypothetical protein
MTFCVRYCAILNSVPLPKPLATRYGEVPLISLMIALGLVNAVNRYGSTETTARFVYEAILISAGTIYRMVTVVAHPEITSRHTTSIKKNTRDQVLFIFLSSAHIRVKSWVINISVSPHYL